jgi:hypothetical protein
MGTATIPVTTETGIMVEIITGTETAMEAGMEMVGQIMTEAMATETGAMAGMIRSNRRSSGRSM